MRNNLFHSIKFLKAQFFPRLAEKVSKKKNALKMTDRKLILSQKDISRRVRELGAAITKDYIDSELLVIGVLNGAFIFMADLVREIKLDIEIDFVRVASYGMSTSSSGNIRFSKDVELDTRGRDVLIVEDIIDTRLTLDALYKYLKERGVHSISTCALVDKKERRRVEVAIDYTGFEVEKGFLIGYGLDCRERYRQLNDIFHLTE